MDAGIMELLKQANKAREEARFEESLKLFDEAVIKASRDKSIGQFAEAIAGRSITLRHISEKNSDKNLLILAKHELEAAIEVVNNSETSESTALLYFQMGNILEKLGEISEAAASFKQAVEDFEQNPPKTHDRTAVLADIKVHQYSCEYMNGNKRVLDNLMDALRELEEADEESYNKNVWVSGAHMRIAIALKDDDTKNARMHLEKAKEVIDSDSRLSIRLSQWEKLAKTIL